MGVPEKFLSVAEKLREIGATNVEIAYVWDRTRDNEGYKEDTNIHEALKEVNPELAERFYREMRIKVWRTDFHQEHFNRRRIVESLLRETEITRGLAEKVAREVEEKIRSTDASVITSPLIRELVLAKLIEMGVKEGYSRYMRLGIPIYDLEKAIDGGNVEKSILDKILTQYSLFEVLPQRAAEYILEGFWDIAGKSRPHIPYAQAFIMRTPSRRAWLKGLGKYIVERRFIDTPSVNIPQNMAEDGAVLSIVEALKEKVIFWSEAEIQGVQKSEVPLYSFGAVDAKVIGDMFVIRADRIAEGVNSLHALESIVHEIKEGIRRYRGFKERFVKKAEFLVLVEGAGTAAKKMMVSTERIRNIFDGLRLFKFI